MSALLRDYARYNAWANNRIVQWLSGKPEAILTQETISSFPTLRTTLLHIWGAQDIWLTRLKGHSPTQFLGTSFQGNTAELFAGLQACSADFEQFLETQPAAYFTATTRYHQTNQQQDYEHPNEEIILHCLQHSTFHRGQIVTMARSLGLTDPPQTDYIAYVRQRDAGFPA